MPVTAICTLKSNSPYSQSRHHMEPKKPKESPDAYDKRTWRFHCHADEQGQIFIPGNQFKQALRDAAEYLSEKIAGKGNSTYTKHFTAGVMVLKDLPVGVNVKDVKEFCGPMNADGKRGSGKRVMRSYPIIPTWRGDVEFIILDSVITRDIFERVLREAGNLIGVGRWRPRMGGMNGRFIVEKVKWEEMSL